VRANPVSGRCDVGSSIAGLCNGNGVISPGRPHGMK
jgi:hypothetical protein